MLLKMMGVFLAGSALAALYMVFLSLRSDDVSGALLYFGFVMLLGLPALASFRQWNRQCSIDAAGRYGNPPSDVRFVPHRFMLGAAIVTGLAILAAILIPFTVR